MNAFARTRTVEARGIAVLEPYLKETAYDGRFVMLNRGAMARSLQLSAGDAIMNSDADRFWTLEIKVEEENRHGNLFLETFSNKNLNDRVKHANHGTNVGWMLHSRADLLLYYFLSSDDLYVLDLFPLQQWAFGHRDADGNIWTSGFRERPQSKYEQLNDTWGVCVPIGQIPACARVRHRHVKQIPLFEEEPIA